MIQFLESLQKVYPLKRIIYIKQSNLIVYSQLEMVCNPLSFVYISCYKDATPCSPFGLYVSIQLRPYLQPIRLCAISDNQSLIILLSDKEMVVEPYPVRVLVAYCLLLSNTFLTFTPTHISSLRCSCISFKGFKQLNTFQLLCYHNNDSSLFKSITI